MGGAAGAFSAPGTLLPTGRVVFISPPTGSAGLPQPQQANRTGRTQISLRMDEG
jgi:hypothetical protein